GGGRFVHGTADHRQTSRDGSGGVHEGRLPIPARKGAGPEGDAENSGTGALGASTEPGPDPAASGGVRADGRSAGRRSDGWRKGGEIENENRRRASSRERLSGRLHRAGGRRRLGVVVLTKKGGWHEPGGGSRRGVLGR